MALWMKATLGLLVAALIAVAAMLAVSLTREKQVFTYPDPDIDRWQVEFTCIEPFGGRTARENADLSYAAFLERRQREHDGPRPSVEEFSARAAEALQSAEQFLEGLEAEHGCTLEFLRN